MVRIYGVTTTAGGGSGGGGGNAPGLQLQGLTQSNSSVLLTSDGTGIETNQNMIIIPTNKSALFNIEIVARTDALPQKAATWKLSGVAKREITTGSIFIVGVSPVTSMSDSELSESKIQLSEHFGFGGISIKCYGSSSYTVINWAATVTLTEV